MAGRIEQKSGASGADLRRTTAESREFASAGMAGLGFEVASQVAAGALLGWLYDQWRGGSRMEVLVGSILGIAVGLFTMIRRGAEAQPRSRRQASPPPGAASRFRRNLSPIAGQTWMLGRATRMMTAKGPSDDRQHRVNFEFGCKS